MHRIIINKTDTGIVTLTLNDPDRRNAMDQEMADAFRSAIDELKNDRSARSLIITGAGRAFAAGGDLQMLKEKSSRDEETNRRMMLEFYQSFLCIQSLNIPTIAAVNGHAIGAGLGVALACDLRVLAATAKLGFTFSKLAIHPGMGTSFLLPRIAGMSIALDLLISGRLFSAEDALNYGLTQKVVSPVQVLPVAGEIAVSLLATGPQAVAGLLRTLRPSQTELNVALEHEADEQAKAFARDEFIEGVTATIERRAPRFQSVSRTR